MIKRLLNWITDTWGRFWDPLYDRKKAFGAYLDSFDTNDWTKIQQAKEKYTRLKKF